MALLKVFRFQDKIYVDLAFQFPLRLKQASPSMIGQTVSHYRIIERLGSGGMGTVYLAEDTILGRRVAIKTLTDPTGPSNQQFRTRFLREARAVSALSHPNIATIHDYGETPEGQPYIVMEFINGETLGEIMLKETLTIPRTLEIIKEVAAALGEAHSHGIIHRDIKPSNVAINHRGEVKVLDFGLAKQINLGLPIASDPEGQTLLNMQTREGVIVGTPMYLSPEQALGVEVDARSDLFSLGGVFYECIAGKPPFFGGGPIEIVAKVIRDDPPPPSQFNPQVPGELDRITLKALAKKPEDRYQTAAELIADLNNAAADARGIDQTITRTIRAAPGTQATGTLATLSDIFKRPRLSVGYVVATIVVLSLIAFAGWHLSRATPHKPTPEAQRFYDLGVAAMYEGAFYKASKLLEESIKEDANFALAHARLAEVWTELDYTDKAKDELIRAGDLVPDRSILPALDGLRLQAVTSTTKRDFAKVIESYHNIWSQAPNSEKAYASLDLGRAYEKNEEMEKAIESYKDASNRDPHYAGAFLRLGVCYGRQQDFEKSDAAFNEAHRLYELSSDIEGKAEVFFQRGVLLNNADRSKEARKQLQQALDLTQSAANTSQRIKTLLQLSSVLYTDGETDSARQLANEAIELARLEKLDNLTTTGLIDLGNVFFLRGEYAEAEKHFRQALTIAQINKGRRGEARALLSLASLHVQQGNGAQAVSEIQPALAFYQQGGYRRETSQALLLLGHANEQKGDYEAALTAFNQQLHIADQLHDPAQLANAHVAIGTLLAHQERYPEALNHFNASLELNQSLGLRPRIAYDSMNRGHLLWQLGRYSDAEEALAAASLTADQSGGDNKQLSAWVSLFRARMALSQLRGGEAIQRSQQALSLSADQYRDITIQAKYTLGLGQALSGSAQVARSSCQDAADRATTTGDPRLISTARLALAEVLLELGDARSALATALQAQEGLARLGLSDSEWRAWLVAARASHRQGDLDKATEYAARANEVLSKIQHTWPSADVRTYLDRFDIIRSQKQLSEILAEKLR